MLSLSWKKSYNNRNVDSLMEKDGVCSIYPRSDKGVERKLKGGLDEKRESIFRQVEYKKNDITW